MGEVFLHGNGGNAGYLLTVITTPGATVAITKGSKTLTATADALGCATFAVSKGNWNIKSALGGTQVTGSVSVAKRATSYKLLPNSIPAFTYTGSYEIVDDNDNRISATTGNWKIRFLSSGTLNITGLRDPAGLIDAFLVGGGGYGGRGDNAGGDSGFRSGGGGGGGGGYAKTVKNITLAVGTYSIVVGGAGSKSTAFGATADPGGNGGTPKSLGYSYASGGIGGAGSGRGGNGGVTGKGGAGGAGVPEFGEQGRKLYGGGGSGGCPPWHGSTTNPAGGGGGAYGNGLSNTGGGGGGGAGNSGTSGNGYSGGSGIVIIRNKR